MPSTAAGGRERRAGDYGAVGDGTTDDTPALQAALDETNGSGAVRGGTLILDGTYRITDTLTVYRSAVQLAGTGWASTGQGRGTALKWDGPAGKPMVRIVDSIGVGVERINFIGSDDPAKRPSAGVDFYAPWDSKTNMSDYDKDMSEPDDPATDPDPWPAATMGTNALCRIRDCSFGQWPWGGTGTGTMMDNGVLVDGDNTNNDEWEISGSRFRQCGTAINVVNSQSTWSAIRDTSILQCETGVYTRSRLGLYDLRCNHCGTDLEVDGTAWVWAYGLHSEHSGLIARIHDYAKLSVYGGWMQSQDCRDHIVDIGPVRATSYVAFRDVCFDAAGRATTAKLYWHGDDKIIRADALPTLILDNVKGIAASDIDAAFGNGTGPYQFVWDAGGQRSTDPARAPTDLAGLAPAKTADYTVGRNDQDKLLQMNSPEPLAVTVPANADEPFPIGSTVRVGRSGTGPVTVRAARGVNIGTAQGLSLRAQHSVAVLTKVAVDDWWLTGDLA